MLKLTLGVMLWSIVHFIPAIGVGFRKDFISRFGEYPYKGVFSVLMLGSLYLIISGWKTAVPEFVYTPPVWSGVVTPVLVLVGFVLFLAPYASSNLKRVFRHPQLAGLISWGVAHLLANGDSRSLVLFGGLAVWALIEMILLNQRDGQWIKPAKVPFKKDIGSVLFGGLAYMMFMFTHHLLFGVSPLA